MVFDLYAVVRNFPLKLRIVWLDTFFDVYYTCVIYVYNDCHWTNHNHRSKTGLTSNLSDAYDAFSSSYFYFSSLLSPMKMSLTSLTMKVLGPGSHLVHALFHFSLSILLFVSVAQNLLVVWVAQNPLVMWVSQNMLVMSVEYFLLVVWLSTIGSLFGSLPSTTNKC